MSGLTEIIDELAAVLTTALGNDVQQIVPRFNLNPTGLSLDIYPNDPFRSTADAGFGDISGAYLLTVRARIATPDDQAAQEALLNLMDDEHALCVAAALMEDETLNGLAGSVLVDGPTGYRTYADNPGDMLGVQWTVTVINYST